MINKHIFNKLLLVLAFFTFQAYGMEKDQFFDQSNAFFQTNVKNGLVNYSQVKNNGDKIHELTDYVATAKLSSFNSMEKLAFYINAYNLYVIAGIVEKYPLASPIDIEGFFDAHKNIIAGESITLNELENNKIRTYNDPRIHFVLVCAALGCPRLGSFSYTGLKLEEQLTQQTKLALNNPDFIMVDDDQVKLSEIFNWYRQDFGKSDAEIIAFINTYRIKPLSKNAKLNYYTYDWTLNDLK
jgi:hypothetical protein